ncbi:MAG: hypothetical protein EOO15_06050 [Chitinophagaceae bacterium]|nr:MAG: hypothetical protein EOO15_06050 [Chitinophagaceae bacterium]
MTTEEMLGQEDLNHFEPKYACSILGHLFEKGYDTASPEIIRQALQLSDRQSLEPFSSNDLMEFHYNVANGWSYLRSLTVNPDSTAIWQMDYPELEKEVLHLRLALKYSADTEDQALLCQILTNLGNVLSHLGRVIDAISCWVKVLDIDPDFGMAIGNLGFGLMHYSKVLYDDSHQFIFCRFAYGLLLHSSTCDDVFPEAKAAFANHARIIEQRYGKNVLRKDLIFEKTGGGNSPEEDAYRNWCVHHRLFLNPLNELYKGDLPSHDCLFLPVVRTTLDAPPFLHGFYNQLKQEYATARFYLYTGATSKGTHFSDKGNLQLDTADYSAFSFNIESTKSAFRALYSLFDKIAYYLNYYLELGFAPDKVSFRRIWYSYSKNRPTGIHPKILEGQNWMLRGLYWLSKDLEEKDPAFSEALLPEAQALATIRNFLEHKSLRVVEIGVSEIVDNGFTYQINRRELEDKAMQLAKTVRAALMYLSYSMKIHEAQRTDSNPSITVALSQIEDIFKR